MADPFIPHVGAFARDGTAPERPAEVPSHYVWTYSPQGISGWRESRWRHSGEAPTVVRRIAHYLQPRLGQPCSQIGMGEDGTRYAFVFENPSLTRPAAFWWQALEPVPEDR